MNAHLLRRLEALERRGALRLSPAPGVAATALERTAWRIRRGAIRHGMPLSDEQAHRLALSLQAALEEMEGCEALPTATRRTATGLATGLATDGDGSSD